MVHVAPPSVVPRMDAPPTASHTEVDGQEMAEGCGALGTLWVVQVAPPSVVPSTTGVVAPVVELMSYPTASHTDVEGQERAKRLAPLAPAETLWVAQVDPPLVVARITGAVVNVAGLKSSPAASHTNVEGQEMALRLVTPLGTLKVVQVAPPLVVAKIKGSPGVPRNAEVMVATTSHTTVEGQEMAEMPKSYVCTPLGRLCITHVAPPSVVPTMTARPVESNPAASHTVAEAQEIAPIELMGAG